MRTDKRIALKVIGISWSRKSPCNRNGLGIGTVPDYEFRAGHESPPPLRTRERIPFNRVRGNQRICRA